MDSPDLQRHRDLDFIAPLSERRAEALVRFLADGLRGYAGSGQLVVDVGCGWAELLLRTLTAVPDAVGLGLDTDLAAITLGRSRAVERGLGQRVDLRAADACEELAGRSAPADVTAAICIGASQIWGPPTGPDEGYDQPLDYRAALAALRALLPTGGRVVYGEGIWSRPPTPAAVAPLSGRLDEFSDLPALLDEAVAAGFEPMLVGEAGQDEWDAFESGFAAGWARWLAEHPGDPRAEEVRQRAARQRAAYYRGYRGTLGMAYLGLVAV